MWERAELESEILFLLSETAALSGIFGPNAELSYIGGELIRLLSRLRSGHISVVEARRKLRALQAQLESIKVDLLVERDMEERIRKVAGELKKIAEGLLRQGSAVLFADELFDKLSEEAKNLYGELPAGLRCEQRSHVHI